METNYNNVSFLLWYNSLGENMNSFIKSFKQKNITCGYLYFYIHLVTEIACFYFLSKVTGNAKIVWLIPFIYDGLAFVPQSLIGYINDLHPKLKTGLIGTILLVISYLIHIYLDINVTLPLVVLCLGNAFLHISGAECTLKASEGKLSHSAIFVGGGSFGVISGRLLATTSINPILIVLLMLTMIPFILLADTYVDYSKKETRFNYSNPKVSPYLIVFLAVMVVIVRGYMGYGIPTSWNKTTLQTVYLFCIMGLGKCLGGILSDAYGIRKVGIISTLLAIPFLCLGNNYMLISLIGVMFFSMTMAITLAILVSVYKDRPGLAFGFTTIGLFLGTAPIFFITITSSIVNIIMITILSIACSFVLGKIIRSEKYD